MAAIRGFVAIWARMIVPGPTYGLWSGSSSMRGIVEPRSAPAEKARPLPVMMPSQASGSASRRAVASENACQVSRSRAFKASGRSRVTVATWPTSSELTGIGGLLFGVFEETLVGLAAPVAKRDHATKQRRGLEAGLPVLLEHRLADAKQSIETDEIG